ncbi:uncharacterized protein PGTG_13863 [Puccinia graminis f. sp. tritici CRL 75-36-700-3]|uniref:Uncharacterized protein n=1 Tax=Puccinia graminis f. sp. tritici (strain CRL 75-36-700-3 / race SCCL) TaxID=418459 RepID=E3KT67_PUCGT|nr:uncharacterized protein PGTG_13863 [Puccinia graminis f. sp. tritici CRL 75-36-700-3]EFP87492.1 hypothetical protein PGTG_13863 [Puccinia graminis f. sp. tritici CRL 75-36-700-3]
MYYAALSFLTPNKSHHQQSPVEQTWSGKLPISYQKTMISRTILAKGMFPGSVFSRDTATYQNTLDSRPGYVPQKITFIAKMKKLKKLPQHAEFLSIIGI